VQISEEALPSSVPEESVAGGSDPIRAEVVDAAPSRSPKPAADASGPAAHAPPERETSLDERPIGAAASPEAHTDGENGHRVGLDADAPGHLPRNVETPSEDTPQRTVESAGPRSGSRVQVDSPRAPNPEAEAQSRQPTQLPRSWTTASQSVHPLTTDSQETDLEEPSREGGLRTSASEALPRSTTENLKHGDAIRPASRATVPQDVAAVPERDVSSPKPDAEFKDGAGTAAASAQRVFRTTEPGPFLNHDQIPIRVVRPVLFERSATDAPHSDATNVHIGRITMEIHGQQPWTPPMPASQPARPIRSSEPPEVGPSRFYLRGF